MTAAGEAEAGCAALNMSGAVDGVISDDSDSLCYGARTVFRNFSTDPKNFSVSRYRADRLEVRGSGKGFVADVQQSAGLFSSKSLA